MILETERLRIHPASEEEMRALIANEEDEGLRLAYGEMLAMSLQKPDQRHSECKSVCYGISCFKHLKVIFPV